MDDVDNKNPEKPLGDIQNPEDMPPDEQGYTGQDINLDESLSQQAKEDKKLDPKKKKQYLFGGIGGAALLMVLMVFSCQPSKGPMAFGICSVFLELNTPYPHTLQYTDYESSYTAIRIYYTSTDPFGEYKQEMIECSFTADEQTGMKVNQILKNRRPVDQATIAKFNILLPTIMASDPYRVLPPQWKNPLVRE